MSDERAIAEMLGQTPAAPDFAFRGDVFARIAQRAARRAAADRAMRQAGVFAALGVACAALQRVAPDFAWAQPVALGLTLGLGVALFAAAAIYGPRATLSGPWSALRRVF